jgi:hypothetical protein
MAASQAQLLIQLAALNLETCQADWLNRITARVKTKRVVPTPWKIH